MATTPDTTTGTDREGRFERTSEPMTTASPIEQHAAPTADTATRSGKATASFICGILAILTGLFIPIVGLILGVVAIVLGATSRGEVKRLGKSNGWMATTGLVLGIIGVLVSLASWAAAIAIMSS